MASFNFVYIEQERANMRRHRLLDVECLYVNIKKKVISRLMYPAWSTWNALKSLSLSCKAFKTDNAVIALNNGKNNNIFETRQLLLMYSPGSRC